MSGVLLGNLDQEFNMARKIKITENTANVSLGGLKCD